MSETLNVGDVIVINYTTDRRPEHQMDHEKAIVAACGKRMLITRTQDVPTQPDGFPSYTEYYARRVDRTGRLHGPEVEFTVYDGLSVSVKPEQIKVVGKMKMRWVPA